MGYEYDSKLNRELAQTAMDIYKKAHKIDQPINESPQNLNEEVIRENVNGLIMNYISDVIILAEAQMGREMTDIEINEASDELLRRIDSISDADKVAFINELSEAMAPTMTASPTVTAGGGGGGAAAPPRTTGGNAMTKGSGAPVAVSGRPTAGGGFDAANYSPEAGFPTAQEALAQMFADGFTDGQSIAFVLNNYSGSAGGPSLGQG